MPNFDPPFKQINWPQAVLDPPRGWGGMARVDQLNDKLIKREFYSLTGTTEEQAYGTTQQFLVPTPDYGDFWVHGIVIQPYSVDGETLTNNVDFRLQIEDVRNGYELFYPDIRGTFFRLGQSPGSLARPGDVLPLFEPYCFTRTGGARLTFTLDAKNPAFTDSYQFEFALVGWLEYAHASR